MEDLTKSNRTKIIGETANDLGSFVQLFKLLEVHGNKNFMNEKQGPTEEFMKIYSCIQLIKTIGTALNNLDAPIVPMLTTHCEFILWRAGRLDN